MRSGIAISATARPPIIRPADYGFEIVGSTPQQLAERVRADIVKYADIVKKANIVVD